MRPHKQTNKQTHRQLIIERPMTEKQIDRANKRRSAWHTFTNFYCYQNCLSLSWIPSKLWVSVARGARMFVFLDFWCLSLFDHPFIEILTVWPPTYPPPNQTIYEHSLKKMFCILFFALYNHPYYPLCPCYSIMPYITLPGKWCV